jgi:hypothetical protein
MSNLIIDYIAIVSIFKYLNKQPLRLDFETHLSLIGYLLITYSHGIAPLYPVTISKAQIARAPVTRGGAKVYERLDFVYFLSIHLKGLEET